MSAHTFKTGEAVWLDVWRVGWQRGIVLNVEPNLRKHDGALVQDLQIHVDTGVVWRSANHYSVRLDDEHAMASLVI